MKLPRVGAADKAVSIDGVISLAFRDSVSSCESARVSCVAALGCNEAGVTVLSKLPAEASAASPSAMPPKNMSALQKMCALMGGSICFFIVVPCLLFGRGEADLDRRVWLLRIHDRVVVVAAH